MGGVAGHAKIASVDTVSVIVDMSEQQNWHVAIGTVICAGGSPVGFLPGRDNFLLCRDCAVDLPPPDMGNMLQFLFLETK